MDGRGVTHVHTALLPPHTHAHASTHGSRDNENIERGMETKKGPVIYLKKKKKLPSFIVTTSNRMGAKIPTKGEAKQRV